jgi:uncharacterized protein YggE
MQTSARMRSKWIAAAALVVVTLALLGVWATSGGHSAAASTAPAAAPDTVSVSGVGTVQGVPDTLTASFDIHVTRGSVQDALNAEASAVQRVVSTLRRHGISGRAVQTASLALYPHYDNRGRVSGYDASETVTSKITPLAHAGAAISAAATASGNDVSVDGLSFDIAEDTTLLTDARSKAFADAKSRAQQYADLTGRALGAVVKVSEVVQNTQVYPRTYDALAMPAAAGAKSVAVQPGEQPVSVTVTVTWRLS